MSRMSLKNSFTSSLSTRPLPSPGSSPFSSTWMSRDTMTRSASDMSDEDQSKKRDKDSESEIRELFRIFDKNHDNTISSAELGKMLRCMGMDVTEADVAVIMKELDKNQNGKIEYREFKTFMQEEMKKSEDSPEELEKSIRIAFQVFDKNNDGYVDAKELRSAMKTLGEPLSDKEVSEMITEADMDRDGKINYQEFIRIWMASANSK